VSAAPQTPEPSERTKEEEKTKDEKNAAPADDLAPAKPTPQKKSLRSWLVTAFKVAVAAVAIGYLLRSKSLDFGALAILVKRPSLFVLNFVLWVVAAGILAALRWKILLTLADARPPFKKLLRLQLIALFFNVVVPGNIGGDVMKGFYVARDEAPEKRPTILLIILVDRIVGLAGLIAIAALSALVRSDVLASSPQTKPLLYTIGLLAAGTFGGPIVFVILMRFAKDWLEKWTSGPSRISKLLAQLTKSVALVSARPLVLLQAVVVSMAIHGLAMAYFAILTRAIVDTPVDFGLIAAVFPIGMLSIVLPISPGGVGVGHVAFDSLYKLIGIEGGATVFNVYLIAQIVFSGLGVIPYLSLKRTEGPRPIDDTP
jgi:uncharacterized protein (TIRG00374 family)